MPCALEQAEELDRERAQGHVRGPLHGIPIALKDNIHTTDMPTTGAREPRGGIGPDQAKAMADAIGVLRDQGAVVIDPADIPSIVDPDERRNFLAWGICGSADEGKGKDASCSVVFKYGMKRDFDKWLASLGERAPLKTLAELRHWNADHQKAGAIKYGQSLLDISDEMNVESDRARYEADRARDLELAGTHGIQEVMRAQ